MRRRPHAPAAGRGRLQKAIARCFRIHGPEVSSSQVYDWAYARNRRRINQCKRHSVWRILRQIAEPICKVTPHNASLWRLKDEHRK